jgi:serine phosphatase RsbU (regulator of sigma subunit)
MALTCTLNIDHCIAGNPLESVNGDQAFLTRSDNSVFFGIVDGAGHGQDAHDIAVSACAFLDDNSSLELGTLMQELHAHLKGGRGGVAIIGRINLNNAQLSCVGVGNIEMRMFGSQTRRLVLTAGVLGYGIRTPKVQVLPLQAGDVLVMHSDGISSFYDLGDYPDLPWDNSDKIANTLIEQFGKRNDDATALVIRIM